ncbi:MAG: HXXEE domain-containing protein [bacterium]
MTTFDWLLTALLISFVLHVAEEEMTGYLEWSRRAMGKLGVGVTRSWANTLNSIAFGFGLFVVLRQTLPLWMRLGFAGLLLLNGITHVAGMVSFRRYVPGSWTGLLFFLPLGVAAYATVIHQGAGIVPILLGSLLALALEAILPVSAMIRARGVYSND